MSTMSQVQARHQSPERNKKLPFIAKGHVDGNQSQSLEGIPGQGKLLYWDVAGADSKQAGFRPPTTHQGQAWANGSTGLGSLLADGSEQDDPPRAPNSKFDSAPTSPFNNALPAHKSKGVYCNRATVVAANNAMQAEGRMFPHVSPTNGAYNAGGHHKGSGGGKLRSTMPSSSDALLREVRNSSPMGASLSGGMTIVIGAQVNTSKEHAPHKLFLSQQLTRSSHRSTAQSGSGFLDETGGRASLNSNGSKPQNSAPFGNHATPQTHTGSMQGGVYKAPPALPRVHSPSKIQHQGAAQSAMVHHQLAAGYTVAYPIIGQGAVQEAVALAKSKARTPQMPGPRTPQKPPMMYNYTSLSPGVKTTPKAYWNESPATLSQPLEKNHHPVMRYDAAPPLITAICAPTTLTIGQGGKLQKTQVVGLQIGSGILFMPGAFPQERAATYTAPTHIQTGSGLLFMPGVTPQERAATYTAPTHVHPSHTTGSMMPTMVSPSRLGQSMPALPSAAATDSPHSQAGVGSPGTAPAVTDPPGTAPGQAEGVGGAPGIEVWDAAPETAPAHGAHSTVSNAFPEAPPMTAGTAARYQLHTPQVNATRTGADLAGVVEGVQSHFGPNQVKAVHKSKFTQQDKAGPLRILRPQDLLPKLVAEPNDPRPVTPCTLHLPTSDNMRGASRGQSRGQQRQPGQMAPKPIPVPLPQLAMHASLAQQRANMGTVQGAIRTPMYARRGPTPALPPPGHQHKPLAHPALQSAVQEAQTTPTTDAQGSLGAPSPAQDPAVASTATELSLVHVSESKSLLPSNLVLNLEDVLSEKQSPEEESSATATVTGEPPDATPFAGAMDTSKSYDDLSDILLPITERGSKPGTAPSQTGLSGQASSQAGLSGQASSQAGLSGQASSQAGLSGQAPSQARLSGQASSRAGLSWQSSMEVDTILESIIGSLPERVTTPGSKVTSNRSAAPSHGSSRPPTQPGLPPPSPLNPTARESEEGPKPWTVLGDSEFPEPVIGHHSYSAPVRYSYQHAGLEGCERPDGKGGEDDYESIELVHDGSDIDSDDVDDAEYVDIDDSDVDTGLVSVSPYGISPMQHLRESLSRGAHSNTINDTIQNGMRILGQKYEVQHLVGEGAYGMVTKCKIQGTDRYVAIKEFKIEDDDPDADDVKRTSKREVQLLHTLRHSNVVELVDEFYVRDHLFIVMEFVPCNLLELLEAQPGGMDREAVRLIMYQLCTAIGFIHSKNVVFRDIKPENILVDENGRLKLCDFGFARFMNGPGESLTDYVATRWYRAPELLLGPPHPSGMDPEGPLIQSMYGPPVDMWAIGCVLGELMDGEPLFAGDSDLDQLYKVQQVLGPMAPDHQQMFDTNPHNTGIVFNIKKPSGLPKRYEGKMNEVELDFMAGLLHMDPKQRFTGEQCLAHPYLADLAATDAWRGSSSGAGSVGLLSKSSMGPSPVPTSAAASPLPPVSSNGSALSRASSKNRPVFNSSGRTSGLSRASAAPSASAAAVATVSATASATASATPSATASATPSATASASATAIAASESRPAGGSTIEIEATKPGPQYVKAAEKLSAEVVAS